PGSTPAALRSTLHLRGRRFHRVLFRIEDIEHGDESRDDQHAVHAWRQLEELDAAAASVNRLPDGNQGAQAQRVDVRDSLEIEENGASPLQQEAVHLVLEHDILIKRDEAALQLEAHRRSQLTLSNLHNALL